MSWLEIFGIIFAFWFTNNLCYRIGVKSGIKHALKELNLEQYQVEKLNTELKKDSHDLAIKAFKEEAFKQDFKQDTSTEGKLLN